MRSELTIGEFATLTRLTVRTLRRYHQSGLLEPATVDPATGYRYYLREQIPTAQVIYRLRQLDVPLAEVASILATDDPHQRAEVVEGHLQRLESELDRTRAAVTSLRRLLRPEPADTDVQLRSVPARARLPRSAAMSGLTIPWPGTTPRWRNWTRPTRRRSAPDPLAGTTPMICSPTVPAP